MFTFLGLLGLSLASMAFVGRDDDESGDEAANDPYEDEVLEDDAALARDVNLPGVVEGSELRDILFTGAGDDEVLGRGGPDHLDGEGGNDLLDGGTGDDELHGGRGDDVLLGGAGEDTLFGHIGDDTLSGMDGNDRLEGGDGRDHLDGGAGRDSLSGGLDDDVLDGGDDRDVLQGGDGDDVLEGRDPTTPARDYLNGGEGDDTVTPGGGDIVSTGRGDDEIMLGHWLADQGPATVLDFEAGKDMLVIRIGSDPAPDVTARAEGGDTQLFLDGAHVATLTGLPDLPDGSVRFI